MTANPASGSTKLLVSFPRPATARQRLIAVLTRYRLDPDLCDPIGSLLQATGAEDYGDLVLHTVADHLAFCHTHRRPLLPAHPADGSGPDNRDLRTMLAIAALFVGTFPAAERKTDRDHRTALRARHRA